MSDAEGLCSDCTSDKYLSDHIRKVGVRLTCVGCGKQKKCISLPDLAKEVEAILGKHFGRSEDGEELNYIVQEIAGVEPEIADRIIAQLLPSEHERYITLKDGGDLFIDEDATYGQLSPYAGEFDFIWQEFCFNVKHSARFFSATAESRLHELLDGIERFKTPEGKACVRSISPTDAEGVIYRARQALDAATIVRIYDDPVSEMGPPPGSLATAGRMNPAGIAVFYGAFDPQTCLAEIRLPVGGRAFTAGFRLVRPIRVLDLTVLDNAVHGVSWLDPAHDHISEQWAFLSRFHDEISRPVLEHEEDIEFIPTQAVAEYLAHKFDRAFDAVIYKSPQTGGEGLNIALFRHASGIEATKKSGPPDQTGPDVTVNDDGVCISHREPQDKAPKERDIAMLTPAEEAELLSPQPDVTVTPTLAYQAGSLRLWRVLSTKQEVQLLVITDLRKEHDPPF